jgi:hypothetical protein
MIRSASRFALLAALLAVGATTTSAQGVLKVGEPAPDYALSGELLWSDGRTELKEFRGNVVLVDFWGYH